MNNIDDEMINITERNNHENELSPIKIKSKTGGLGIQLPSVHRVDESPGVKFPEIVQ